MPSTKTGLLCHCQIRILLNQHPCLLSILQIVIHRKWSMKNLRKQRILVHDSLLSGDKYLFLNMWFLFLSLRYTMSSLHISISCFPSAVLSEWRGFRGNAIVLLQVIWVSTLLSILDSSYRILILFQLLWFSVHVGTHLALGILTWRKFCISSSHNSGIKIDNFENLIDNLSSLFGLVS